jgi:hypothetical protein
MISILCAIAIVATPAQPRPSPPVCQCASARSVNGWCTACDVGYVAGVAIKSAELFEILDAHGHHVNASAIRCQECRKNKIAGGYCPSCRLGFVGGQAYHSLLTYVLTRGERRDPAKLTCSTCKKHAASFGWCDACKLGWLGQVELKDRKLYENGLEQFKLMLRAIEESKRCSNCAAAMFVGGKCRVCLKTFPRPDDPMQKSPEKTTPQDPPGKSKSP